MMHMMHMMFRTLTAPALLAASACASALGAGTAPESVAAQTPTPAGEPLVVNFGAHWRSGILTQSTQNFVCPGGTRISITSSDVLRGGNVSRPVTVGRIDIDGRLLNATVLGALNDKLKAYASKPQITPECIPEQIRLHIFNLDDGTVTNSRYLDIENRKAAE